MNDECRRLYLEFFYNSVEAEEHKLKNQEEELYFDCIEALRKSYVSKSKLKYLKRSGAFAFLAKEDLFEDVQVLSIFFPNKQIKYFIGDEDELITVKVYHELEGMPA